MIYIDATNQVLGRMASSVAKMLLSGEHVSIVNAEKAVCLGNPNFLMKSYLEKRERGDPYHGPFYPKRPDRIVRRVIRGMLPYTTQKGRKAFKRLRVFISIPDGLGETSFRPMEKTANPGKSKSITLKKLAGYS